MFFLNSYIEQLRRNEMSNEALQYIYKNSTHTPIQTSVHAVKLRAMCCVNALVKGLCVYCTCARLSMAMLRATGRHNTG